MADKANGFGIKRLENGDVCEGTWANGKLGGKGTTAEAALEWLTVLAGKYRWADGNSYEGDFVDDSRDGFGVYRWLDGSIYEGQFVGCQRSVLLLS